MKRYNVFVLALICLLSLTGCSAPTAHERSVVIVEWMDFVKIGGVSYRKDWGEPEVSVDRIGEKMGEVTCEVPNIYVDAEGNLYPHELKDGTSFGCEIGTELFSVIDRNDAIAALVGGKYYLYSANQKTAQNSN